MKNIGIVRRIDDLGRIVIPKEIRRGMDLHEGDAMELWVDEQGIMLKKYIEPETSPELFAAQWLREHQNEITANNTIFTIDKARISCEVILNNTHKKGYCATSTTYLSPIAMVIAYCNAIGTNYPKGLTLI